MCTYIKLFIIGNGFDLHHGLKTSYSSFKALLSPEFSQELESLYTPKLWSEFEAALGDIYLSDYFIDNNYEFVEPRPYRDEGFDRFERHQEHYITNLQSQLGQAFERWIAKVKIPQRKHFDGSILHKDDLYLCFNYTSTLEKIYNISFNRICYIHGNSDRQPSEIIYGHGKKPQRYQEISDKDLEWLKSEVSNEEFDRILIRQAYREQTYKNVDAEIFKHRAFFDYVGAHASEVYVLGHSISEIDLPYFETVLNNAFKCGRTLSWKVSYYNENEAPILLQRLKSIGVDEECISILKLSEIIPRIYKSK